MPWHLERVRDGFHEGTTLPRILDYLVNDEGVRIRPLGSRDQWLFSYTHGDLQFQFAAYSTTPGEEDLNKPPPLGPLCRVSFLDYAARVETFDQNTKASIGKNIIEALLAHHKFPTATSPHVEQVVFDERAKRVLDQRQS